MKKLYNFIILILLIFIVSGCSISYIHNDSAQTATFTRITAELKTKINNIIQQHVTKDMSEFDIARVLHDYIIITTEFDSENLKNNTLPDSVYTACGVLLDRVAVCQGYAEAYKLLAEAAGLNCKIVTGMTGDENHAWNIIEIDGEWYNVDVTWDDPTGVVTTTGTENLKYNYFLIPDSVMHNDHTPFGDTEKCTSDKYLYGMKEYNTPFITLDSIYSLPSNYVNYYLKGKKSVTFYFPENIDTIDSSILNSTAQKLAYAGISTKKVSYTPIVHLGTCSYTTISFY